MIFRRFRRNKYSKVATAPFPPESQNVDFVTNNSAASPTPTHPSLSPKVFGPLENKFSLFRTTQEDLLRVAIENKRASSRLRQAMALRAVLAESEGSPIRVEDPDYDFACVGEEDGEFVMGCLQ